MLENEEKDEAKAAAGAIGGKARAEVLSPEERSEIASTAALVRWGSVAPPIPRATHTGELKIGDATIPCAVLEDGTRLLTEAGFLRALGRNPRGKGRSQRVVDGLPPFLSLSSLKPLITDEIIASTVPVVFKITSGPKAFGYRAELLPKVCELFLAARDAGFLTPQQLETAAKADILIRSLAQVGIVALIDEATGFQEIRDREALQSILDHYLRAEYAKWAKRFPDDFYREMFRLRKWPWKGMKVNRPQAVAGYTTDIVYARIAPGILAKLEELNPKDDRGHRKVKHHQWLTEEIGHPALQSHIGGVTALMRVSEDWKQFMRLLQRAYPKINTNLSLPFVSE